MLRCSLSYAQAALILHNIVSSFVNHLCCSSKTLQQWITHNNAIENAEHFNKAKYDSRYWYRTTEGERPLLSEVQLWLKKVRQGHWLWLVFLFHSVLWHRCLGCRSDIQPVKIHIVWPLLAFSRTNYNFLSVLWRCHLGDRNRIWSVNMCSTKLKRFAFVTAVLNWSYNNNWHCLCITNKNILNTLIKTVMKVKKWGSLINN